jgi:hypothetical protein
MTTSSQDLTYERHEDTWVFSDGTVLPVVSGGDETAGDTGGSQEGTATGGSPAPQGEAAGNGGQQQGQGSSSSGDGYSLGPGFLQRVPEEHRAILEPYVKQWDAGVTRRFQELQSQLAPYQEFGDIENISAAMQLAQVIDENPWQVYGILHQALMGQQPPVGQEIPGQQPPQGQQDQGLSGPEGELPPQAQQRLDQMQQMLVALAQHVLGEQATKTQAQEDQELDSWLQGLHTEFGDFDDQWVLMRVYQGSGPEEAIKAFNDLVQERAGKQLSANGRAPNLLGGGGGATATGNDDVRSLSRGDTKSLVASVLAQASQAKQ